MPDGTAVAEKHSSPPPDTGADRNKGTEAGDADQPQSTESKSMREKITAKMHHLSEKVKGWRSREGHEHPDKTLDKVAKDTGDDTAPAKPVETGQTSEGFSFTDQKTRLGETGQLPPDELKNSADSGNILAKTVLRKQVEKKTTETPSADTGSNGDTADTKPLPAVEDTSGENTNSGENETDAKSWWQQKRKQMAKNKEFRSETRKLVKVHYNRTGFAKTKDAEGNKVDHAQLFSKELNAKHKDIYGVPFLPQLNPQEREATKQAQEVVDRLNKTKAERNIKLGEMLRKYGLSPDDLALKNLNAQTEERLKDLSEDESTALFNDARANIIDSRSAQYAESHKYDVYGLQNTLQKDLIELNSRIDPNDPEKMRSENIKIGGKEYTLLQAQDILYNTIAALPAEEKAKIDYTAVRKDGTQGKTATEAETPSQIQDRNQRLITLRDKARADYLAKESGDHDTPGISLEELIEYQQLLAARDAKEKTSETSDTASSDETRTEAVVQAKFQEQTDTVKSEGEQPNDELTQLRKNLDLMNDEKLQDRLWLAERDKDETTKDEVKKIIDQKNKAKENPDRADATAKDKAEKTTSDEASDTGHTKKGKDNPEPASTVKADGAEDTEDPAAEASRQKSAKEMLTASGISQDKLDEILSTDKGQELLTAMKDSPEKTQAVVDEIKKIPDALPQIKALFEARGWPYSEEEGINFSLNQIANKLKDMIVPGDAAKNEEVKKRVTILKALVLTLGIPLAAVAGLIAAEAALIQVGASIAKQ